MMTTKRDVKFMPPLLPIEDIVAFVFEMGGDLEDKNLLNPTSEVIWPLYELLAEYVCSLSRDELQQPAYDVWRKLECPEMHRDSVACVASWRTISQLMVAARVNDFSFRDLIKPVSSRTTRFLSSIINFAKFRKERENKVAELQDEVVKEIKHRLGAELQDESIEEIKHQLAEDREHIMREIAAIEADRHVQMGDVEGLEAETDELYHEMSALNKKQLLFQADIRALKHELASLTDAISGQKYILQEAKKEGSELREQIVESPEALKKVLEEKKAILDNTEAAAEEAQKSLQRWKQKLETFLKAEKKMHKLLGLLEEVQKPLTKVQAALKEVKILKAKIKSAREEIRDCDAELERLTLNGRHVQDLMETVERVCMEKSKEEERASDDVKVQYANLAEKQHVVKADIVKSKAQIQYLLSKKASFLKTADEERRNSQVAISFLQQETLGYYRSLLSCTEPIVHVSS